MSANTQRKPSKHLTDVLSENVKMFRKLKGLSQEELADISGIHRTYVGSVERGERNVTLSSLEMLANALGVTVIALLTPGEK